MRKRAQLHDKRNKLSDIEKEREREKTAEEEKKRIEDKKIK